MPMIANTPSGISVTVMTTIRIVADIGIHISSGYPTRKTRVAASTAFRVSTMPPNSLPESV